MEIFEPLKLPQLKCMIDLKERFYNYFTRRTYKRGKENSFFKAISFRERKMPLVL